MIGAPDLSIAAQAPLGPLVSDRFFPRSNFKQIQKHVQHENGHCFLTNLSVYMLEIYPERKGSQHYDLFTRLDTGQYGGVGAGRVRSSVGHTTRVLVYHRWCSQNNQTRLTMLCTRASNVLSEHLLDATAFFT